MHLLKILSYRLYNENTTHLLFLKTMGFLVNPIELSPLFENYFSPLIYSLCNNFDTMFSKKMFYFFITFTNIIFFCFFVHLIPFPSSSLSLLISYIIPKLVYHCNTLFLSFLLYTK